MPEAVAAPAPVTPAAAPTPEAPASPPPAPADGGALKSANKALNDKRKSASAAKGAPAPAVAKEGEPEKPAEAKPDLEALDTDKLFAPETLTTPEGIERARNVALYAKKELEKRAGRLDGFELRLAGREKKLESDRADFDKRANVMKGLAQSFMSKMQIIRGERAAGNTTAILAHLDELAGGKGDPAAGAELYEQLSIAMARDGKIPEKSREVRELEERIRRAEEERKREREDSVKERERVEIEAGQERIAQAETFIAQRAKDPAKFPMVAGWISAGRTTPEAVGKYVGDLIQQAAESGEPLDLDSAIGILEQNLTPPGVASGQASSAENGSEQPTTLAASRPARAAPTVLPSDADRSSGSGARKETDEQRRARLARDPDFLRRSGIGKLAGLDGFR